MLKHNGTAASVFCGIDWAENHHDIALVDMEGAVLARLVSATTLLGSPNSCHCWPPMVTPWSSRYRWR